MDLSSPTLLLVFGLLFYAIIIPAPSFTAAYGESILLNKTNRCPFSSVLKSEIKENDKAI